MFPMWKSKCFQIRFQQIIAAEKNIHAHTYIHSCIQTHTVPQYTYMEEIFGNLNVIFCYCFILNIEAYLLSICRGSEDTNKCNNAFNPKRKDHLDLKFVDYVAFGILEI